MTLPDFIQYFRDLAAAHKQLKGFAHGPVSRIIGGARSENEYPLLWLETPTLGLLDKDGTAPYGQRSAAVVVLLSVSRTDFAEQDAGWALTEQLALDVLSRLRKADKAREISFATFDGLQLEAVAHAEPGQRNRLALRVQPRRLCSSHLRPHPLAMSLVPVNVTWRSIYSNPSGSLWEGTGLWFDTSTKAMVSTSQQQSVATLDPRPVDMHRASGDQLLSDCGANYLRTLWLYDGSGGFTITTEPNSTFCGYTAPLTCQLGTATVVESPTTPGLVTAGFTGNAHGGLFFSLDGGAEQASPVFRGVTPGAHVVKVRDDGLAGCERTVSFTVAPTTGPALPPAPTGPSQGVDFVGQPLWRTLTGQPVGALVELELWAESAHGAADFAPVLSLRKRVGADGQVSFRLDALLWPLLRAFVPTPGADTQRCTSNLLDYYLRFTTTALAAGALPVYDVSELRTALRGGLPAEWQSTDYFSYRLGAQFAWPPFLSWQPTGAGTLAGGEAKPIAPGQPEWLFFLCPFSLATQQLQVSRAYRMTLSSTPVVDVEPLARPVEGWAQRLLAIPLRDTRTGFTYLTVQVQDANGNAVSLPAAYQFVAAPERPRYLLFTNSLGGLDTARCTDTARLDVTLEAVVEKTERPARPGDAAPAADRQVSDLVASRKLKLAVGWRTPRELAWLQELVLSREIWQQVGAQLRPLDWSKRSLAAYADEPGLRGLLLEGDYAYASTAYAPTDYA